jgi:alkyl hydroperoxide reductase subunit F
MLDPPVATQIAEHLRLLQRPVELVAALGDAEASREVGALLDELAALSDLVSVSTAEHRRRPSFAVTSPGTEVALRFAGAPTGDALTSLVLALLHVGGHPPKVDPAIAERIRDLDVPLELETWFATSCRSCGDTLHALGAISVLNPTVRHTAINGAAFRDEAAARGIAAVPVVFVNGERLVQGRSSLERVVDLLERLTG